MRNSIIAELDCNYFLLNHSIIMKTLFFYWSHAFAWNNISSHTFGIGSIMTNTTACILKFMTSAIKQIVVLHTSFALLLDIYMSLYGRHSGNMRTKEHMFPSLFSIVSCTVAMQRVLF